MDIITVIVAIITAIITGLISFILVRPKIKASVILDEETAKQNEQLKIKQNELLAINDDLCNSNSILHKEYQELQSENNILTIKKQDALKHIQDLQTSISIAENQAQEAADLFYKTKMDSATEALERALEQESQNYQANVEHFKMEYNETVAELMEEFKGLSNNITVLRATNDAAIAAAKRAEEMKDQQNYYRIQLSAADIKEIELLRSVEPHLRDKEPLNKVIWKVYYEKPTTDMIGRVVGSGVHTGIYKLTDITTGKCYVGQAANIADRWKQHIKRGIGAEVPTRNKLYPAMNAIGPENFTFEIIEECDRGKLDAREDYWQDYFKAKEFGYSIK